MPTVVSQRDSVFRIMHGAVMAGSLPDYAWLENEGGIFAT